MSGIKTGGPAFPELGNVGHNSDWQSENGMTLREYFAAHCPITMREAYETWRHSGNVLYGLSYSTERRGFMEWWAIIRFEYADAMIAAREDKP